MLCRHARPKEIDHLFVKAMNEGDVEAMLALYEPDQVFVSQPGQPVVRGAGESLREKLRAFYEAEAPTQD